MIPGQRCFELISSHQQGIRTACLAHHRFIYAHQYTCTTCTYVSNALCNIVFAIQNKCFTGEWSEATYTCSHSNRLIRERANRFYVVSLHMHRYYALLFMRNNFKYVYQPAVNGPTMLGERAYSACVPGLAPCDWELGELLCVILPPDPWPPIGMRGGCL